MNALHYVLPEGKERLGLGVISLIMVSNIIGWQNKDISSIKRKAVATMSRRSLLQERIFSGDSNQRLHKQGDEWQEFSSDICSWAIVVRAIWMFLGLNAMNCHKMMRTECLSDSWECMNFKFGFVLTSHIHHYWCRALCIQKAKTSTWMCFEVSILLIVTVPRRVGHIRAWIIGHKNMSF